MNRLRLRSLIREIIILETGGAAKMPQRPVMRNPTSPSMADREQIGKNSIKITDVDELAPHLRDPVYDEEDTWGPVPPTSENPYSLPDFYTQDYSVLPTPRIMR